MPEATAPAGQPVQLWKLPDEIGCFALYDGRPAAPLRLCSGLYRLGLASDALIRIQGPPYDPLLYRFNEGEHAGGQFRFRSGVRDLRRYGFAGYSPCIPLDAREPEQLSAEVGRCGTAARRPERPEERRRCAFWCCPGMALGRRSPRRC